MISSHCLQIRHHFLHDVVHRNDLSLLAYGFVQRREWPLLCAQDLPGHHDLDDWPHTPSDDEEYSASLFRSPVCRPA